MASLLLTLEDVLKIHAKIIVVFGGREGIRDEGALSSALVAVENRKHYDHADLAVCAATYAYHLTQAHAFVDGNKRVAAAASEVFLAINEARLLAGNEEVIELFLGIASGTISRTEAEEFFSSFVVLG